MSEDLTFEIRFNADIGDLLDTDDSEHQRLLSYLVVVGVLIDRGELESLEYYYQCVVPASLKSRNWEDLATKRCRFKFNRSSVYHEEVFNILDSSNDLNEAKGYIRKCTKQYIAYAIEFLKNKLNLHPVSSNQDVSQLILSELITLNQNVNALSSVQFVRMNQNESVNSIEVDESGTAVEEQIDNDESPLSMLEGFDMNSLELG